MGKGPAFLSLMVYYNWSKAIMLTNTAPVYVQAGHGLTTLLKSADMEVLDLEPTLESLRVLHVCQPLAQC